MGLWDKATLAVRAGIQRLLRPEFNIDQADRLAAELEIAEARLAMLGDQLTEATTRKEQAQAALEQARDRIADLQRARQDAENAGQTEQADALRVDVEKMQTFAGELDASLQVQANVVAEIEETRNSLNRRIARTRGCLPQSNQPANSVLAAAVHPPAEEANISADLASRIERLAKKP